jgi:hypothetical protein
VTSAPGLFPENGTLLRIEKASLEKEFLFQAGRISQVMAPLGVSLQSRIVAFRQWGDKVYLLEATKGHTVTYDLPQTLILTSFPVVKETEHDVTFDFNMGMTQIFGAADWHTSDLEGGFFNPSYNAVKTRNSVLTKVETEDNRLRIDQLATLDVPSSNGSVESAPVLMRYYIAPYAPNPGFQPVRSPGFDRLGFFEIAPFVGDDGQPVVLATKFDLSKPIVYAISSNTPKEFREAVRSGILYYNKILGEGKVQVVDAPAGVTAPDPGYNIIQWINWDEGGFAYADAQMDPRTGETLHAQVYFTSAFAFMGKKQARRLLARLESSTNKTQPIIGLQGFQTTAPCQFADSAAMATSLRSLLAGNPSDDAILRAAQDYVRLVVAHEVGHTLGMRHNFAGSLAANTSTKDKMQKFLDYLQGKDLPETLSTTSSVMDYLQLEDAVIAGYRVAHAPKALDYDEKALRTLYFGASFAPKEIPLFCTDTVADGSYADCLRFDEGGEQIPALTYEQEQRFHTLADRVFESFLDEKEGIQQGLIHGFSASPKILADSLILSRNSALRILLTGSRFLRVDRSFPSDSDLYDEENLAAFNRLLTSQFADAGGMASVMATPGDDFFVAEGDRFSRLVEARGEVEGLSPEDRDEVKAMGTKLFAELPGALRKEETETLTSLTSDKAKLRDLPLSDDLATALAVRAENLIFAETGQKTEVDIRIPLEGGATRGAHVSLPKFRFEPALRTKAGGLLGPGRAESPIWGLYERSRIKADLKKLMDEALTTDSSKLKPEDLPAVAGRWLLENQGVLTALDVGGAPPTKEKKH